MNRKSVAVVLSAASVYLPANGDASPPPGLRIGAAGSEAATGSINRSTNYGRLGKLFTGVCGVLVLSSGMFKGALVLALGLCSFCLPLAAQQAKHTGAAKHRVTAAALKPLDSVSDLSIYRPKVVGSSDSILFRNGPVRAWSDGAQLVSESAFVQIGMAPLGLFPASYYAPSEVAPTPMRRPSVASDSRSANLPTDGKDLSGELISSPLNRFYYTGEVGFMYGRWSGKGDGDFVGSYVFGQAGNDKFQISAGASFENWSGNSQKIRAYPFSR